MERFLVSAATGALKAVTVKLSTLMVDEFKDMKDVREEMESLSKELNCMHAFLENKSQEEKPNSQDKIWVADVREMSYDIEDSLDDLMICLDNDKSVKTKSLIKKCKKLLAKMKAQRRISKAIHDFKTQIKVVSDRNERYRARDMMMSTCRDTNNMIDTRALVIFGEASKLVGIDKSKNELIRMLTTDGSSSEHQVKVVSVVGCGGLGKTTLAKQVYESLKHRFDCHAFVTVSRNPDMVKVLRTILSQARDQDCANTEAGDVQHLIQKISNFLEDKRYFVVVDDLWDSQSWKTIKCAFIKNSCGSRIITTTRKNELAEYCLSSYQGHIYTLPPLNSMNSRRLFHKRIFTSEDGCPSHLTKVSDDILKKCGGLPLAIISIAGLLAGKAKTFDEWNRVQSSFGYALERQSDVNEMIQILSLSYFDLPPHLRSCLLYLSIFPEDYDIGKDRLIMRWIAEGFIHEEHGFTQYELGERFLIELINRNLIQPMYYSMSGVLNSCQVHDTILEFIVSKAVEENFVTLFGVPSPICDPQRKIRRQSLQDKNKVDDASGLREKMIYYHARAISIFSSSLSLPSLQKFRYVSVLDLEGCEGLQGHHLTHLGGLFALRYLGLRYTDIDRLPDEIGKLQHLHTLDVRHTDKLKELPSSVVRLARLVNLLCDFGVRYFHEGAPGVPLPDGFGNMQALQRLKDIRFWRQPPGFAHELRQLRNLRVLKVYVREFTQDLVSCLSTLGAGSLNYMTVSTVKESMNFMIEPWSPTPISLKLLVIEYPSIPNVPRWIGLLYNLQHLALNLEYLGPADVVLLGHLNALSCLHLKVMSAVAYRLSSTKEIQRVKISGAHGFPSLREFCIGSYACGFGLLFEAGAMPKLQELEIEFDRDKTSYITNGGFDFGIKHLQCLATVIVNLGYSWEEDSVNDWEPEDDPVWDALKVAVNSNPNHPRLCQKFG